MPQHRPAWHLKHEMGGFMEDLKEREDFENSPRFRGMDFTRSTVNPEYYESPYANGAWDGWKASRESIVIELPSHLDHTSIKHAIEACAEAIESVGLKVAK